MLKELDDYDWGKVFECSGGEGSALDTNNDADVRPAHPDEIVSLDSFGREDVETIFGIYEGIADEKEWECCGQLKDGRFFFIIAGCDYTGWDCQSGGHTFVSMNKNNLLQYGMTEEERKRLGVE
jgi:hypothetical protein